MIKAIIETFTAFKTIKAIQHLRSLFILKVDYTLLILRILIFKVENTVHFPDSIHPQDPPIKEKTHERITIVETPFPRTAPIPDDPPPHFCAPITNLAIFQWIYRQCTNTDNRYAFQVGIGFTIAALLVMITPASNVIPSVFWVGKVEKKRNIAFVIRVLSYLFRCVCRHGVR